jgi:hypothetical protein
MKGSRFAVIAAVAALALTVACSRQSQSPTSPSSKANPNNDASADGSTLKVTAPTPTSPINDAQASDPQPTLTASPATPKFDPALGPLLYRFEVYNETGVKVQDSGLMGSPSFKITVQLSFQQRQTWRVRAEFQGLIGPWSRTASFISAAGGYIRGNEAYDPLFNGQTVATQIVGQATFVPGVGLRIENTNSFVKYAIPVTITSGEFSVEVLGLRPNAPGGKLKVMTMSSAFPDFTTDPYRFDIQYRGSTGSPPNAITFRALYGSADDLSVRYEPDTGTRNSSVFLLNPATPYLWKVTWGAEARVQVYEGGIGGRLIYNVGVKSSKGTYNPQPQFAYLGSPPQRSGEDQSIPGTIYRNMWIGARPRPF